MCKVYVLIMCLSLMACTKVDKRDTSSSVAAFIDTIPISLTSIDNRVRQELFDELNRIYYIRKIALEDAIKEKVLLLEAQKLNITIDSLLNRLYEKNINDNNMKSYIIDNQFDGRISELRKNLVVHDINTEKGQKILMSRYKQYILNQYIDSLKTSYKINVLLKPPLSPIIKLKDLLIHYRGNLKSKIILIEISDFECDMCRENKNIMEYLFSKYKDKVRFGYTHYGSYVSNAAIASECAANQGEFWKLHDSIFASEVLMDSNDLFRIAKTSKLDMKIFKEEYYDKEIFNQIENNLHKLESAGIYGTPTIMINNRLIFNSASVKDIESILLEEIAKYE